MVIKVNEWILTWFNNISRNINPVPSLTAMDFFKLGIETQRKNKDDNLMEKVFNPVVLAFTPTNIAEKGLKIYNREQEFENLQESIENANLPQCVTDSFNDLLNALKETTNILRMYNSNNSRNITEIIQNKYSSLYEYLIQTVWKDTTLLDDPIDYR